jgi:hypothetical protein
MCLAQSDDDGDESDFEEPNPKPKSKAKPKPKSNARPKLITKPISDVDGDWSLAQSDDDGDESDFEEPKPKPKSKPKPKPKLTMKPSSDVDGDDSDSDVNGEVVSSIDGNKKMELMAEVFSLYSDRKKAINGAIVRHFNEIILAAKTNTSIHDIVLTERDKQMICKQYAKSINAPSMAMTVTENNRLALIRHGDALKVAQKGYRRTSAEKRKADGITHSQQKLDSNGAKLQHIQYDFEPCYAGLKAFTLLYGHSDVPEDHPLYAFCCQVRASFWSRAQGGKKSAWHNNPHAKRSNLTKDQFILLGLLDFVWTKPPKNWRDVTNAWEPVGKRPYVARKTYHLDELFPGGL